MPYPISESAVKSPKLEHGLGFTEVVMHATQKWKTVNNKISTRKPNQREEETIGISCTMTIRAKWCKRTLQTLNQMNETDSNPTQILLIVIK